MPEPSNRLITKDRADYAGKTSLSGGPHTSRTMMLAELRQLLATLPPGATKDKYRLAILDDNVLGKRSVSSRQRSFRYLRELYALDPDVTLFRGLQHLWRLNESAQPLLALSSALQRDPSFRPTAAAILETPRDSAVSAAMLADAVREAHPGSYSDAVAHKIGRNAASTWTQSGHLDGRSNKIRVDARPTPQSVAYALFCAHLSGLQGEPLFDAVEVRAQDAAPYLLRELAREASRRGFIDLRSTGGVTEVRFAFLESPLELTA
jgi:hypothetical protein